MLNKEPTIFREHQLKSRSASIKALLEAKSTFDLAQLHFINEVKSLLSEELRDNRNFLNGNEIDLDCLVAYKICCINELLRESVNNDVTTEIFQQILTLYALYFTFRQYHQRFELSFLELSDLTLNFPDEPIAYSNYREDIVIQISNLLKNIGIETFLDVEFT